MTLFALALIVLATLVPSRSVLAGAPRPEPVYLDFKDINDRFLPFRLAVVNGG